MSNLDSTQYANDKIQLPIGSDQGTNTPMVDMASATEVQGILKPQESQGSVISPTGQVIFSNPYESGLNNWKENNWKDGDWSGAQGNGGNVDNGPWGGGNESNRWSQAEKQSQNGDTAAGNPGQTDSNVPAASTGPAAGTDRASTAANPNNIDQQLENQIAQIEAQITQMTAELSQYLGGGTSTQAGTGDGTVSAPGTPATPATAAGGDGTITASPPADLTPPSANTGTGSDTISGTGATSVGTTGDSNTEAGAAQPVTNTSNATLAASSTINSTGDNTNGGTTGTNLNTGDGSEATTPATTNASGVGADMSLIPSVPSNVSDLGAVSINGNDFTPLDQYGTVTQTADGTVFNANGNLVPEIDLNGTSNLTIENAVFDDSTFGVNGQNTSNITVQDSNFNDTHAGVLFGQSSDITVSNNLFTDMQGGTYPNEDPVQVGNVTGYTIDNNTMVNDPGQSGVVDNINSYYSSSYADAPSVIANNLISGYGTLDPVNDAAGTGIQVEESNGTAANPIEVTNNNVSGQVNGGIAFTNTQYATANDNYVNDPTPNTGPTAQYITWGAGQDYSESGSTNVAFTNNTALGPNLQWWASQSDLSQDSGNTWNPGAEHTGY